jgi:hypothetical protein
MTTMIPVGCGGEHQGAMDSVMYNIGVAAMSPQTSHGGV